MKILFLLFILLSSVEAATINSINFNHYKNFEKKWKLITVRFRKDTEEMRFTYANPLAYETLKKGLTTYPDGAVFAKIGVMTGPDTLFESSSAPLGARRIQFMSYNKNLYKKGHGWGYALFDNNGNALPEDSSTQEEACIACHDLAQERGYVFSQDMFLNTQPVTNKRELKGIQFTTELVEKLPPHIKDKIPATFKYYKKLQGKIATKIFQGTIDEIRPALSQEVFKSKYPAILISSDSTRWNIVFPEQLGVYCDQANKNGIFLKSIFTTSDKGNETKNLHYCFSI